MADMTDDEQAALAAMAQQQANPTDQSQSPIGQAIGQAASDNGQAPPQNPLTVDPDQQAALAAMAAQNAPAPSPQGTQMASADATAPMPPAQPAPVPDASQAVPVAPPAAAPAQAAPAPVPSAQQTAGQNVATSGPAATDGNWADYNKRLAMMESGNNPSAKNPQQGATASGLFQITDGTYSDLLQKHPDLQGLSKNDPKVIDALNNDNSAYLKNALGHDPSMIEMYAAHFLGAGGAVKFLTAYSQDPNTPATSVVQPGQVAMNKSVFFNPDGTPKTVGQIYNSVATRMGSDSLLASGNGQGAGQAASSNPFDRQQAALDAYQKSQPAMWAKLQDLQNQYQAASKPSTWDQLQDTYNTWMGQHAAAVANQHASAGGELLHSSPDAKDFIAATKAGQDQLNAQRAIIQNRAKAALDAGSTNLLGQMQMQGQNLGLSGDLVKAQAANSIAQQGVGIDQQRVNLEATKNQIELAKFNQEQNIQVQNQLEKAVPNVDTRAKIAAEYNGLGLSNAPVSQQLSSLSQVIAKHAGDTSYPLAVSQPVHMFSIATPDGNGGVVHTNINAATPAGQKALENLPQNAVPTDLGSPQSNVTLNNGGASGGEGGQGGGQNLAQEHLAAIQTKQASDAALQLLPYLKLHGGTGPLTESPGGQELSKSLQQAFPNLNIVGSDARQIYAKLVNQVQIGVTLPAIKAAIGGGRLAQSEFQTALKTALGPDATPEAAAAFLQHVSQSTGWQQQMLEAQSDAAMKAKQANNPYFDPTNFQINYQKNHVPPAWDTTGLTAPQGPQSKTIGGVQYFLQSDGSWKAQ